MKTLSKKIIAVLEARDWNVCSVDKQGKEYVAELETTSPAGEDFAPTIRYDGTSADFARAFDRYALDFDPDEHAEDLARYRGTNGVPNSIRTLINDADEIKKLLEDTADALREAVA